MTQQMVSVGRVSLPHQDTSRQMRDEPTLLSAAGGEEQGQFCTTLGHQHGPRQQPKPGMSTWPLVAICHEYQHRPLPLYEHRPRDGPQQQHRLAFHFVLRWAGYSHQVIPLYLLISSSIFLYCTQIILLFFLPHFSTTYLVTPTMSRPQGGWQASVYPHLVKGR